MGLFMRTFVREARIGEKILNLAINKNAPKVKKKLRRYRPRKQKNQLKAVQIESHIS